MIVVVSLPVHGERDARPRGGRRRRSFPGGGAGGRHRVTNSGEFETSPPFCVERSRNSEALPKGTHGGVRQSLGRWRRGRGWGSGEESLVTLAEIPWPPADIGRFSLLPADRGYVDVHRVALGAGRVAALFDNEDRRRFSFYSHCERNEVYIEFYVVDVPSVIHTNIVQTTSFH